MARGPIIYQPPPGTIPQNPGDVIQSAIWNAFVQDVTLTFNTIQPIEYGGSNAATPIGALDNFHTRGTAIPSAATTDIWSASGDFVHVSGTTTITGLGTANAAGNERTVIFDGILTLTHNATSLILPGAANITTAVGDSMVVRSEGGANARVTSYQRAATFGGITSLVEQSTTSGTSKDYTAIPAWVKRITVNLYKVSTVAGSQIMIQLGDSGGVETTGYEAIGTQSLASGSIVTTSSYTTGFGIRVASAANETVSGSLVLSRSHATDNVWIASGNFTDFTNSGFGGVAGNKLLSATLDRVRLTTIGGVDTFDAGAWNIDYQ